MRFALFSTLFIIPIFVLFFVLFIYLTILIIRALRKYIKGAPVREEKQSVRSSLAEKLREHRVRCKMTQEFVAETIGVSRQAVSKWENGASDPSTANLIALAKLYGISPEELLVGIMSSFKENEEKT